MNEQLAKIYGTGQTDTGEDLEKNAAAELLVKLAEQEGIDLSKCSDEQVMGMLEQLYKTAEEAPGGESSGEESKNESAEEGKKEEPKVEEKEAQAKFAEADFLGRVMAHAYVQELGNIKEAGAVGEAAGKAYHAAGKGMEWLGSKLTPSAVSSRVAESARKGQHDKVLSAIAKRTGGSKSEAFKALAKAPEGMQRAILRGSLSSQGKAVSKLHKGVGLGAAGAAAVGAEEGVRRGTKKESSALDTLIQQRAIELAKTAGYVDEEGNLLAPQTEKQASALDVAVETAALQLLEANGYPVEWSK